MNIEYRAPRNQTELQDTIECSIRAFGSSEHIQHLFTNIVDHDPWFDLNNTRACFVDGKAASVVQIFERPMRIGNCVVRMGGVGSVGTDPPHRRGGYSSEVLRNSVEYMQAAGYDLSILGTGIQSHYARSGWVMYPTYTMTLTLPETLGQLPADVTIESYEPSQDLPAVRSIYDQFNAARTGTVAKNVEYWANIHKWRPYDPSLYWIAEQDGKTVAYLQAAQGEIGELGYLAGAQGAMEALLSRFFQHAKAKGIQQIDAPTPSESRKIFEAMGCSIQRRESNGKMFLITNFASLLTKIKPLLESRLRASDFSGWTGAIRIRYEAGERTLVIRDGVISVAPESTSPDSDLLCSQSQLLRLLFGNMNAEQVAFSNRLRIAEIGLLDALFPPGEFFMWHTDRF